MYRQLCEPDAGSRLVSDVEVERARTVRVHQRDFDRALQPEPSTYVVMAYIVYTYGLQPEPSTYVVTACIVMASSPNPAPMQLRPV